MSIVAKKIMMGSGAVALPSDSEFNRTSFLSHFDGSNDGVNNQFTDGSASNHTITANGNVTQGSFGPFARPDGEWGVSFDGDEYLSVAETGADEFTFGTGDFTIEGWINNQAVDASQSRTIISTAQGNDFQGIWFGISGGNYYYIYNNAAGNNWDIIVNAGTPVVNAWTHFALVRNGTSNVVYINGSSIGSTTETARDLTNTNNLLAIGGRATASQYTISTMSNVRVVKGTAVYTGNFTPSTSKLTAITNTKLLTCQSNRFVDNSASPLTITPTGNPAVTAFGPFLTSAVYDATVNGASAYFDGSGDYLTAGDSTDYEFGAGDFTIEAWVYASSVDNPAIVSKFPNGARQFSLELARDGDNHARYRALIYIGENGVFSNEYIAFNAWNHIAIVGTASDTTARIYTNGIRNSNTISYSGGVPAGGTDPLRVGSRNSGGFFYYEGYICDLRLLKGTAAYSGASFTPPTAPLTAITNTKLLLNMADGQAIDSAAQNNLTLYGNAKISTGQAKFGNTSMVFDGTGDYVTLPSNSFKPFGTGDFTIECFARFDAINGKGLFQLGASYLPSAVTGPAVFASIATNNPWRIYYGTSDVDASVSPSANTWYHVAYVRSSGVTKLYVDGTSVISQNDTTNYTNTFFVIGGGYSSSFLMDGYIDDFRISHMARYTSDFTAPTKAFPDKGQDA